MDDVVNSADDVDEESRKEAMMSSSWTSMDAGLGIIKGTGWGMLLSNGIYFASVSFRKCAVISLYHIAIMDRNHTYGRRIWHFHVALWRD